MKRAGEIAYREAVPDADSGLDPLLCVHGFPESSLMWNAVLEAVADSGRRAIALDLPGFGDSPPDPPGTWERQVEALERFAQELGLDSSALAVHDWGGLIGLRWACDNPGRASALVVSNTGFFPDGKWHGAADVMRTPGKGEEMIDAFDREGFAAMMRSQSSGFGDEAIAHYWRAFETEAGRHGVLELYRSGDFQKLEPYRGRLAALGIADAGPLGRGRPVRARRRRLPLREGGPGRRDGRRRRRGPLRLRRRARALRARDRELSQLWELRTSAGPRAFAIAPGSSICG